MSDKSIPVDTGHVDGGNAVEQRHCGALVVNEFACAPLMERSQLDFIMKDMGVEIRKISSYRRGNKVCRSMPLLS